MGLILLIILIVLLMGGLPTWGHDSLPLGYQLVVLNGVTYYFLNGVYYQPYIYGGQTVYLVVSIQ